MRRVYFPNLNGVRFIAATMVVVCHIEQMKTFFGLPSIWYRPEIRILGTLGVVLFFVLSGFLITFLLLDEEQVAGRTSIPDFYKRRILRIWPLYYLIVIGALFVLPRFPLLDIPQLTATLHDRYARKAVLMLLFLPNVVLELYGPIPYASQAWSVGVEEQFYLIWPLALRLRKSRLQSLYAVLGAYAFVRIALWLLLAHNLFGLSHRVHLLNPGMLSALTNYFDDFALDSLALGGLAATLLIRRSPIVELMFRRSVQIAVYVAATGLTLLAFGLPHNLDRPVYSLLFAMIILNLAANRDTIISLENRLFDYLGKVSYGLYMYHVLAIILTIKLLVWLGLGDVLWLQYTAGSLFTFILAALSYEGMEKRFIRAKLRFSRVVSGENVREHLPA